MEELYEELSNPWISLGLIMKTFFKKVEVKKKLDKDKKEVVELIQDEEMIKKKEYKNVLEKIEVEMGNLEFTDYCGREIYVYPICQLQEEFREYSVLRKLAKNSYLS